ncbi:M56 family metallopeptidase [Nonomuraea basaltis]|uniref:M56 family metallopeptidase n=1 Tax=Nonomuraea basaltis TaxID=2495887 RepID=UPI00110C69A8|nr:M56 family metallopeptidase [Nonomuraea basaltis]TMR95756.1 M56 family metallopeptidase [Nonomuraea basaltis]
MIAAVLAVYAVLATTLLPRLLVRARWSDRAPRLAISLWLAACASAIASAILAAVATAVPADTIGHGLASVIEACFAMLDSGFDPLAMPIGAWLALLAAALIVAWAASSVGAMLFTAWRERRRHAEMLRLLGRRDGALGAIVLEYDEPLVYCLPGRQAETVVTTAALRSLPPESVAAVLAHERAHLRGRHHLVLALADGLKRAFPGLPLFATAKKEIVRLVELRADDVAARHHPRIHIAAALVSLATGRAPAFTLGAGGETALARVRRMLHPAIPLCRREKFTGMAAVGVLLAGPAAVALFPGLSALVAHHCHNLFLL